METIKAFTLGAVAVITPAVGDAVVNWAYNFDHMTAGLLHIAAAVFTILIGVHQLKKK